MDLQRRLQLSHLQVTIFSVIILAILVMGGFVAYTQTRWAVSWVQGIAAADADSLGLWLTDSDTVITSEIAEEFVFQYYAYTIWEDGELWDVTSEELGDELANSDWVIVLAPDGTILGSNFPDDFAVGRPITAVQPPVFKESWFDLAREAGFDFYASYEAVQYGRSAEHVVALAPVIRGDNELAGWIYYRTNDDQSAFLLRDTAKAVAGGLIGASLIAVLISWVIGNRLAANLTERLRRLSTASAQFAAGDYEQRIVVEGEDEIAQLSAEFNQMAEQISNQMVTLRDMATLAERNRLARELHDAIKQQLFGLSLTTGSIESLLDNKPEIARQRLRQVNTLAGSILEEMDSIIKQLRPASLEDRGLVPALSQLVEQWEGQTGVPIQWQPSGERELPLPIEQTLYRVTQEALNNIARHAQASAVTITLSYGLSNIILSVQDDGIGFDTSAPNFKRSLGLRSMRERVEAVNGTYSITSKVGIGTHVTAEVPISSEF